ncbi:MAG: hypothetical protein AAGI52_11730 [Bacteroidota bacterium]
MAEKRFTEEEAQRIFARVAERQHYAREGDHGLTLAEMQEAARASGLDPSLVAAVAMEMRSAIEDGDEDPTFWGAPLRIRRTRVLPVDVDEDGWARIVTELRRAFDTPGVPTEIGRQREWTSTTAGSGVPIHVTLTPGEGTSTITIEQSIAKQARGSEWILPLGILPVVLLAGFFQAIGEAGARIWWLPVLVGLVMSLVVGGLWFGWRNWGRKTEQRFERAMDRVELAARDAASELAPVSAPPASVPSWEESSSREEPRLSLDALPQADALEPSRTRTRLRS